MSSVKGNIVLNGINTLTGILFPVITFPYAARVLLPEGIGAVNFLNSIVGYIVLLTSLGIPMYAVREVAKYRDDKAGRDKITAEIMLLSTGLCLTGYAAVWALARFVPQIHSQAALFYILSLSILFTTIGVNWFYQGIEDFKFITVRAIVVRTLCAAALFVFVHDSSDLPAYGMIVVGSTVGNNIINFVHLRRHVDYRSIRLRELRVWRHVRPAVQVFVLNLIISLYIQLNSIMLGFISGDEQVGYFTAGTKITHIGLTIITSVGTVLLPRCSNLLQNGDLSGFSSIIGKSLNVTQALAWPMMTGLMVLAYPVTLLFCGPEYVPSIPVLYLNAPVILLVSLTNIMGIQVLYPMDKIKIVIASVSGGAIVNLLLNFVFIPPYGATGAAITTLIAETMVLVIQAAMGRRYYPFRLPALLAPRYIVMSAVMCGAVCGWIMLTDSLVWQLAGGIAAGALVYLGELAVVRDPVLKTLLRR